MVVARRAPRLLNASRLVGNEELAQMRGGFFTAAGAEFDFGASVQTLVNGQLALLTKVQWTPAGAVTQQLQGLGSSIQAQVANNVATNLANAGIATPGTSMQTTATTNRSPPSPNACNRHGQQRTDLQRVCYGGAGYKLGRSQPPPRRQPARLRLLRQCQLQVWPQIRQPSVLLQLAHPQP